MLRAVSCWPLAVLFLASVLPSNAQSSSARGAEPPERRVEVAAGAPLWVSCPLRPEQRADWRLDDKAPPADALPGGEAPAPAGAHAGAGLTARLHVAAARARHAGVYTCAPGGGGARVRVVLVPAPAPAPAPAQTPAEAGSAVDVAESADAGGMKLVYFEVRHNITLDCADLATDAGTPLVWKKNGTLVEQIPELAGRFRLDNSRFDIWRRALEDDFGNYSCAAAGSETGRAWQLRARTHAKLPPNTNVVEEQKIKLSCRLIGKPYQGVVWRYSNSSETVSRDASEVVVAVPEEEVVVGGEAPRIVLKANEQGVAGAELVIAAARLSDAGWYSCEPRGPDERRDTIAVTQLRVKDKYAALWPFLGICAEVFVLCAIILIYERRRTKPELDDSDTDNHDQKKS